MLGTSVLEENTGKDSDNDGITDFDEYCTGSNPRLKDTDFDGLNDNEDIEPTKYNYRSKKDEIEYQIIKNKFDMAKVYMGEDGKTYIYVKNLLTGKDVCLFGEDTIQVIYYDSDGEVAAYVKDCDGILDVNTYTYEDGKIASVSNNGYLYDITYNGNEIKTVSLNESIIYDVDSVKDFFVTENINKMVVNSLTENNTFTEEYYLNGDEKKYLVEGSDTGDSLSSKLISGDILERIESDLVADILLTKKNGNELSSKIYYNDNGTIRKIEGICGNIYSYEYDEYYRIVAEYINNEKCYSYEYDGFGQLVYVADIINDKGYRYEYKYDNLVCQICYEGDKIVWWNIKLSFCFKRCI